MSKRFTDTEKYKKAFIRGLPCAYKLLWDYLYHDCDFAGIWQKDFEVAQIRIGNDAKVDEQTALELFNKGEQRIVIFDGGSKWFIKPFVPFQYGELNPKNRAHLAVLSTLERKGLNKPLGSPLEGAKEKEKEKDKDSSKERGNPERRMEPTILESDFEAVWKQYPNKDGKKDALRHFKASVLTDRDLFDIQTALTNYLKSEKVLRGFVKDGSTWFNGWKDWIAPTDVQMGKKEEVKAWDQMPSKTN